MSCDAALLGRLVSAVAREETAGEAAKQACRGALELVGADGAAITHENPASYRVMLYATGQRAAFLENLQDVLEEGPCLEAFRQAHPVRTALDRQAARRWPRYVPAAARVLGPGGRVWALPLRSAGEVLGTMNLYLAHEPGTGSVAGAQLLADLAGSALTRDPAGYQEVTESATQQGWSSRALVHQAAGMLVSQLGVGPDEALARMRSHAFAAGAHLNEVAGQIIKRGHLPQEGPGGSSDGCTPRYG